jgi:hypothetical protein
VTHGPSDTGEADPRLAAALAGGDRAEVLAALVDARVFAAVTATGGSAGAAMAVVLMEAPDGTRALPAFLDVPALLRWRPDARPVPLTGPAACQAALEEQAHAVVLDPAGAALTIAELDHLARGWVPVPGSSLASRRGEMALQAPAVPPPAGLVAALRAALRTEDLRSARLLDGHTGPVLGVTARQLLRPEELAALADRLVRRLGDQLPPAGLDLTQVPARGPGHDVLRTRRLRRGR